MAFLLLNGMWKKYIMDQHWMILSIIFKAQQRERRLKMIYILCNPLIIGYRLMQSIITEAKMVHIEANTFVCGKSSI